MGNCRTCFYWLRVKGESGRCDCPEVTPDPEYGNVTLESDGCKHHTEEPEMDEPRDQY